MYYILYTYHTVASYRYIYKLKVLPYVVSDIEQQT